MYGVVSAAFFRQRFFNHPCKTRYHIHLNKITPAFFRCLFMRGKSVIPMGKASWTVFATSNATPI